jgi:hypothetical protein
MADTTKNASETGTTQTTPTTGSTAGSSGNKPMSGQTGQSATGTRTARDQSPFGDREGSSSSSRSNMGGGEQRGSDMMDQAREQFGEVYERASDVYDRASRGMTETWDQAMDYGRRNPGTATLIAFGAGVGFGLLMANGMNSRSRSQRIVPPVMSALSEIAAELFR